MQDPVPRDILSDFNDLKEFFQAAGYGVLVGGLPQGLQLAALPSFSQSELESKLGLDWIVARTLDSFLQPYRGFVRSKRTHSCCRV